MPEAGTKPFEDRAEQALLPQTTVWLMAITVGVIVANIYYVQPLRADIANTFGLSVTRAGTIAMLSQAGTALGMFLFVPLGDKYERRSLILLLVIGGFVSLLLISPLRNNVAVLWVPSWPEFFSAFYSHAHLVDPSERCLDGALCMASQRAPCWSSPWSSAQSSPLAVPKW